MTKPLPQMLDTKSGKRLRTDPRSGGAAARDGAPARTTRALRHGAGLVSTPRTEAPSPPLCRVDTRPAGASPAPSRRAEGWSSTCSQIVSKIRLTAHRVAGRRRSSPARRAPVGRRGHVAPPTTCGRSHHLGSADAPRPRGSRSDPRNPPSALRPERRDPGRIPTARAHNSHLACTSRGHALTGASHARRPPAPPPPGELPPLQDR